VNRPENTREALRVFIDYWVSTYSLQHGRKRESAYTQATATTSRSSTVFSTRTQKRTWQNVPGAKWLALMAPYRSWSRRKSDESMMFSPFLSCCG